MTNSKLSRILAGLISVDKDTLDKLLRVLPTADRERLVIAYLQDAISPFAIAALKPPGAADPWGNLDFRALSPKGEKALRFLLESDDIQRVERIFVDLAAALGQKT
jgi:hypothetical protein